MAERTREITVTRRLKIRDATCPYCKRGFEAVGRARFCSPRCRVRADYEKHAIARREASRERYRRSKQGDGFPD